LHAYCQLVIPLSEQDVRARCFSSSTVPDRGGRRSRAQSAVISSSLAPRAKRLRFDNDNLRKKDLSGTANDQEQAIRSWSLATQKHPCECTSSRQLEHLKSRDQSKQCHARQRLERMLPHRKVTGDRIKAASQSRSSEICLRPPCKAVQANLDHTKRER
jgi:hypothetical protein